MVAMLKMEQRRFWVGCILILVGIILIFLGFYEEPVGELSGSLLAATGEVFTLGGSFCGIDAYVEYKVRKLNHNNNDKNS